MPRLDIVKNSGYLLNVADRNRELKRLSGEREEVFGQVEDDRKLRAQLCADDRMINVPLCVGWILTTRASKLLDLAALSREADDDAIFVIHFDRAAFCVVSEEAWRSSASQQV